MSNDPCLYCDFYDIDCDCCYLSSISYYLCNFESDDTDDVAFSPNDYIF